MRTAPSPLTATRSPVRSSARSVPARTTTGTCTGTARPRPRRQRPGRGRGQQERGGRHTGCGFGQDRGRRRGATRLGHDHDPPGREAPRWGWRGSMTSPLAGSRPPHSDSGSSRTRASPLAVRGRARGRPAPGHQASPWLASRQRRPATAERTQSSRDPKMTWAPMLAGAYQAHLAESVMVGSGKGEGPVPGSCSVDQQLHAGGPQPFRGAVGLRLGSTSRAVETSSSTPSAAWAPSSRAAISRSSDGGVGREARRRRSACRAPLSQRWSARRGLAQLIQPDDADSSGSRRHPVPPPASAPRRGADHVKHGHRAGRRGCRARALSRSSVGWTAGR